MWIPVVSAIGAFESVNRIAGFYGALTARQADAAFRWPMVTESVGQTGNEGP